MKKAGDKIGFLLEFDKAGGANLSFFKNGLLMGRPFVGLPLRTYHPCVSLMGEGTSVTL